MDTPKCNNQHHTERVDPGRALEEDIVDDERILEKGEITLHAVWALIGSQKTGPIHRTIAFDRHVGQQDETARQFSQPCHFGCILADLPYQPVLRSGWRGAVLGRASALAHFLRADGDSDIVQPVRELFGLRRRALGIRLAGIEIRHLLERVPN